jgi:hypothetical protein
MYEEIELENPDLREFAVANVDESYVRRIVSFRERIEDMELDLKEMKHSLENLERDAQLGGY